MARRTKKQIAEVEGVAEVVGIPDCVPAAGAGEDAKCENARPDPVSVDWVVREARRTYDAAHEAGSLSTAVSCLNLIGKHLAGPGGEEEAGAEAGVFIVTGIDGAPGSDVDD